MISQWNELEINTRKKKKYLLLPINSFKITLNFLSYYKKLRED